MPCEDSSSSMVILLNEKENFKHFEYAKITCGQRIGDGKTLVDAYLGKSLPKILDTSFQAVIDDLDISEEEEAYILYLEWELLRSGIALYLGIEDEHIDTDRCIISSIEHTNEGIEIVQIVLPPKTMTKILPCSLKNKVEGKED